MHEMGIACSVLDAVHAELRRYPGQKATKVGLRIGEFAGLDPDSLRFCFQAIVKSSEPMPLVLEIEWLPECDEMKVAFLELEEMTLADAAPAGVPKEAFA